MKLLKKWGKGLLVFAVALLLINLGNAQVAYAGQDKQSDSYKDGEYEVELQLVGGSGRASVTSPAKVIVQDGKATVTVIWSSSNYDYMVIDGTKYNPVNTEGNSTFCIPIDLAQNAMTIIADTTAMSTPHEIEYELQYMIVKSDDSKKNVTIIALGVGAICGGIGGYMGAKRAIKKKKENSDTDKDVA